MSCAAIAYTATIPRRARTARATRAPCGYTREFDQAGRYTQEDAGRIVTNAVFLVAVLEDVVERYGRTPPRYHPYRGDQMRDD